MKQFEQTYTINAPVSKVWQALTDASVAEAWGAAPAKVTAKEGGEFSYWGGDIHGTYTELVSEKLIKQDWYEHEHAERLHKVTFTLENTSDTTTAVHLAQTDIGDDEFANMIDGWSDYYFDPIKKLLEK